MEREVLVKPDIEPEQFALMVINSQGITFSDTLFNKALVNNLPLNTPDVTAQTQVVMFVPLKTKLAICTLLAKNKLDDKNPHYDKRQTI